MAENENLTGKNGAGYGESDEATSRNGLGLEPANPSPESPGKSEVPEWVTQDPAAAYRELQKARDEAAKYRQLKQEQEAARQKALEEQGDFKALYEELKAKHDSAAQRLETYEQKVKAAVETRSKALPESVQTLLSGLEPGDALAWLEAHADEFVQRPRAPKMDAGVSGDQPGVNSVKLTPEQIQMAQRMGIPPEKLAEQIKRRMG